MTLGHDYKQVVLDIRHVLLAPACDVNVLRHGVGFALHILEVQEKVVEPVYRVVFPA